MSVKLDLLNHEVVQELVVEAYHLGNQAGGGEGGDETNDEILEMMRSNNEEEENTE